MNHIKCQTQGWAMWQHDEAGSKANGNEEALMRTDDSKWESSGRGQVSRTGATTKNRPKAQGTRYKA